MPTSPPSASPGRNFLLSALPADEAKAVRGLLEPVPLPFGQVVQDVDAPLSHVWFPRSGVVSMLSAMEDGSSVEVATIGRKGMIGVPLVLGSARSAHAAFAQIPGDGERIAAAAFTEILDRLPAFRRIVLRYTLALISQISQGSACNRLHPLESRCARWLLMTHDRVDGDQFPLTHEFLAQMLGVTRPSASVAAGMLQRAGLIRYVRGVVTILDRGGLETASCECYAIIASEFARLVEEAGALHSRSSGGEGHG